MAVPAYVLENRYTFVQVPRVPVDPYQVETPENAFERSVQHHLAEANAHLRNEEYQLALTAFQRLGAEILRVANPQLPVVLTPHPGFTLPYVITMLEPLFALTAGVLKAGAVSQYVLPGSILPGGAVFEESVSASLSAFASSGVQASSPAGLQVLIDKALAAASDDDWAAVEQNLAAAIETLGDRQAATRALLIHDMAIAKEKLGDRAGAIELAAQAAQTFGRARDKVGQHQALLTGAALNERAGNADAATQLRTTADALRLSAGLDPVVVARAPSRAALTALAGAGLSALPFRPIRGGGVVRGPLVGGAIAAAGSFAGASPVHDEQAAPAAAGSELGTERPILLSGKLPRAAITAAAVGILASNGKPTPVQATDAGVKDFYAKLSTTSDLALLMDYIWQPATIVAYLPHIYFFVIPMAIGDCLAGLRSYEEAIASYQRALAYPFMNTNVEAVRLWTRLAETHLEWGDSVYRRAGDEAGGFAAAAAIYSRIVRADGTIDAASPLYAHPALAAVKARVQVIASGLTDPAAISENPALVAPVLDAYGKLQQIGSGLNYLGIAGDFRPPFTFEYLQSIARMLAEQAERAEQGYINFKSQAENEQLRADQLDQQVEVAAGSVTLERRSLAEADAGVTVAQEGLDYATTKRQNAEAARNQFSQVRWDLLDLTELEAWAGASSVDKDDQVRLTITGYSVYEAQSKKRNDVIADLSRKRTRITHDLEAARLQREVTSAIAYQQVAQAQLTQARARVAVAQQRVALAELQLRHARENAEFLDLKEFSARTWYELARTSKRLVRRYLDMAIEVAYVMERAYELETGRDLARIRFDYAAPGTGSLLAASRLHADVESFTHDLIVSTTTKKAPIKTTYSLSEEFPVAHAELKATGRCSFDTTLARHERAYPGAYLGRIVAVEVQFVGLTNAGGILGTLRNVGVSRFRDQAGSDRALVYPTDVLPLSQYEVRNDALVFRFDQKELRLFENCGLETGWLLEVPPDANDVDLSNLLDVRLAVYWDAFYDVALETAVRGALPGGGSASKAYSLALLAPDEVFFLQQNGEAAMEMAAADLPYSQASTTRTRVRLRLVGDPATAVGNTAVQLTTSGGGAIQVQTDADGVVNSSSAAELAPLLGQPVPDVWTLTIEAGAAGTTTDVQAFVEYDFDYRTGA